jgi:hypothetical protein
MEEELMKSNGGSRQNAKRPTSYRKLKDLKGLLLLGIPATLPTQNKLPKSQSERSHQG